MVFPYQFLKEKYKIEPRGIIHIGAHYAEESTEYSRCGTDKVLWLEGNPELLDVISNNISIYPQNKACQALLSDEEGKEVVFKITNASMSSSILDLGSHKTLYPGISIERELKLQTSRFENFIKRNRIIIEDYDFVNLDIQGAELMALKGFGELLYQVKYIYTEVNIDQVYKGCALLDELDEFLLNKGFDRVEISLKYGSWGDAFYLRKELSASAKQKRLLESKALVKQYQNVEINKKILSLIKPINRIVKKVRKRLFPKVSKPQKSLIDNSGEKELAHKILNQYREQDKVVIIDIGANYGKYSEMIMAHCEALKLNYEMHLFEPQSDCIRVLNEKFDSNKRVIINNLAISGQNGFTHFYMEARGSEMSSIYQREVFSQSEKIEVATKRIDDYLLEKSIRRVNLIKIDVEGHELEVLKSASSCFSIIDNIQFEYGGTYIDSKTTLKEVYSFLREKFYIGKIESGEVAFMPFIAEMEDFKYSNYLAERIGLNKSPVYYYNTPISNSDNS